jgi:hypothetical protein
MSWTPAVDAFPRIILVSARPAGSSRHPADRAPRRNRPGRSTRTSRHQRSLSAARRNLRATRNPTRRTPRDRHRVRHRRASPIQAFGFPEPRERLRPPSASLSRSDHAVTPPPTITPPRPNRPVKTQCPRLPSSRPAPSILVRQKATGGSSVSSVRSWIDVPASQQARRASRGSSCPSPAGFTMPEAARRLVQCAGLHVETYAHVIDALDGRLYESLDALIAAARADLGLRRGCISAAQGE